MHSGFSVKVIVFISLFCCFLFNSRSEAYSPEWSQVLPSGTFKYSGKSHSVWSRLSYIFNHTTDDGIETIKSYKRNGFTCLRKSQIESICFKITENPPLSDSIKQSISEYLNDISLHFKLPNQAPEKILDTSTQIEFLVRTNITIKNVSLDMYRWVHNYEKNINYIQFPTSHQPIAYLISINKNSFLLPLQLNSKTKDGGSISYLIHSEYLEKEI